MIGEAKNRSCVTSSQTWLTSRSRTNAVESTRPTAPVKTTSSTSSSGIQSHDHSGEMPFAATNTPTTTRLTTKVIAAEIVTETGITWYGNESLRSSDPRETSDVIARVVPSRKKFQSTIPISR